MADVTLVKTRHDYASYTDFWTLVDVSGYATCYIDEMQTEDRTLCYIIPFINAEWQWTQEQVKARTIHWNMEWFGDVSIPRSSGIRETWTADKHHAKMMNLRYVPVGSHPKLKPSRRKSPQMPVYDATLAAYLSPRRSTVVNRLCEVGLKVMGSTQAETRHDVLMNTRCILHVHQIDRGTVSPLRFALAAAYGLPVLSEQCDDMGIYSDAIPVSTYDNLVAHVDSWLSWGNLDAKALELHDLLCHEYTFKACVEAAL